MEAKFEAVHKELAPQFRGRLKPKPADYQARGAVYLPDNARFSRLLQLPGTAKLGTELNGAMKAIAETNPDLAGALPQGYSGAFKCDVAGAAPAARAAEDRRRRLRAHLRVLHGPVRRVLHAEGWGVFHARLHREAHR